MRPMPNTVIFMRCVLFGKVTQNQSTDRKKRPFIPCLKGSARG